MQVSPLVTETAPTALRRKAVEMEAEADHAGNR